MTYTYLLNGTPEQIRIARVRKEIDDRTSVEAPSHGKDYFQTDEDIADSLVDAAEESPADATEKEVRLTACASILDTLATNQAYVLKKQRTMSEESDGPAVAASIRAHAKSCRDRATASRKERREAAALEASEASPYQEPSSGGFEVVTRF